MSLRHLLSPIFRRFSTTTATAAGAGAGAGVMESQTQHGLSESLAASQPEAKSEGREAGQINADSCSSSSSSSICDEAASNEAAALAPAIGPAKSGSANQQGRRRQQWQQQQQPDNLDEGGDKSLQRPGSEVSSEEGDCGRGRLEAGEDEFTDLATLNKTTPSLRNMALANQARQQHLKYQQRQQQQQPELEHHNQVTRSRSSHACANANANIRPGSGALGTKRRNSPGGSTFSRSASNPGVLSKDEARKRMLSWRKTTKTRKTSGKKSGLAGPDEPVSQG